MHSIALYVNGNDEHGRMVRRTLMRYLNVTLILVLRSISSAVKRRFPTLDHVVESGEYANINQCHTCSPTKERNYSDRLPLQDRDTPLHRTDMIIGFLHSYCHSLQGKACQPDGLCLILVLFPLLLTAGLSLFDCGFLLQKEMTLKWAFAMLFMKTALRL